MQIEVKGSRVPTLFGAMKHYFLVKALTIDNEAGANDQAWGMRTYTGLAVDCQRFVT